MRLLSVTLLLRRDMRSFSKYKLKSNWFHLIFIFVLLKNISSAYAKKKILLCDLGA